MYVSQEGTMFPEICFSRLSGGEGVRAAQKRAAPVQDVQAKRGGGEGGASARERAATQKAGNSISCLRGAGRIKQGEEIKSSLVAGLRTSLARSDFLPSATKWHKLHGFRPLKVFSIAVSRASVREKSIAMLTQARDCNSAQCPPTA